MLRNFPRQHNRKALDLPADSHNKPGHPDSLRYPDNYTHPPVLPRNNRLLHWRHRHIRNPNCHPNHSLLRQRLFATKKSLRPDWHSNLTNPFSAIRAISFWAAFPAEQKFPRPVPHSPKYTAYHNIRVHLPAL